MALNSKYEPMSDINEFYIHARFIHESIESINLFQAWSIIKYKLFSNVDQIGN